MAAQPGADPRPLYHQEAERAWSVEIPEHEGFPPGMTVGEAIDTETRSTRTGRRLGYRTWEQAGMRGSSMVLRDARKVIGEYRPEGPGRSDEFAAWTGHPRQAEEVDNPHCQAEALDAEPRRVRVQITESSFAALGDPAQPDPVMSADGIEDGPVAKTKGTRVTFLEQPENPEPKVSGEEVFAGFVRSSARKLERHYDGPPGLVRLEIEADTPVAITNLSDLHLGNLGTDHRRALEDAKLVRDTPGLFAVFGGDGVDNFIKHASAMVSSTSNPEQEYAALEYYLSLMEGKLLGGITGNHDYWTRGFSGIDHLRGVFRRLRCPYGKHVLRPEITVKGPSAPITYRVELRHTYRYKSSLNLSNQLQRMYDMSEWQWDIGLVGHTHDGPFTVPFDRHGKQRWGGLSGSYKVKDDHSRQWGFNDAKPSSPVFILDHRRRKILGVPDLRQGVEQLRAIRHQLSEAA